MMATIPCAACQRPNLADRRFCGGCGASLALPCTACKFSNHGVDRFCGGCGIATGAADAIKPTATKAARGARIDVVELFDTRRETTSELPRIGIDQGDLDKLFGGGS
jgi:hypothetical protein